ncbi:MAG: hypothetical protein MI824_25885 [Hyphomicrobiales bacterium]|nr:hypothetical protein [Hyphomicrobiales bacterium]
MAFYAKWFGVILVITLLSMAAISADASCRSGDGASLSLGTVSAQAHDGR